MHGTFAGWQEYRYGTRRPVSLAPVRLRKATTAAQKARFDALVDKLAVFMKVANPTPFRCEGPFKNGIRSALCLRGSKWDRADLFAARAVREALHSINAKRPTWQQGQPEFTQFGFAPVERTRCVHCTRVLPEGSYKFCGPECHSAWFAAIARMQEREDYWLDRKARRFTKARDDIF